MMMMMMMMTSMMMMMMRGYIPISKSIPSKVWYVSGEPKPELATEPCGDCGCDGGRLGFESRLASRFTSELDIVIMIIWR